MEINNKLIRYSENYLNSTIKLDLKNQKIEFIDVFGNNVEQSLNDWLYIYNQNQNCVEKVKLIISEVLHSRWNYKYLNIYYFKYNDKNWGHEKDIKEKVKNLIYNDTKTYYFNDLKQELNDDSLLNDNIAIFMDLLEKEKIRMIYKLVEGLDFGNDSVYLKKKINVLFGNFNDSFILKTLTTSNFINNNNLTFKIRKQTFSKGNIVNEYLYNLFTISNHPDCCGVKIISNHNTIFTKNSDFKRFDKDLTENIKLHFYLLKMKCFGLAPFMAHLIDKQLKSALYIYKKLFVNFRKKTINTYMNPNSDNKITVLQLNMSFEESNHKNFVNVFHIFLYFWFLNLKDLKFNPYYDINLLENSKTILQNDK